MPRHYRRMAALRPIQRIKHVVDFSATIVAGATSATSVILATDTPTLAVSSSVQTGSTVHGIYLKVEVASNEAVDLGAIPNVYLLVLKNPGGNLSFPSANAVGTNDNKKYVIHQEMVMIENKGQGSNGRILFNGVIVIPKGYKRFGPNDLLQVNILSPALNIAFCAQVHYKEFR